MEVRALLLSLLLLGLLAVPAGAAPSGRCLSGGWSPTCGFETGTAVFVGDGDTIDVRLRGSRAIRRVRLTGVQAMEQTRYSSIPSRRRGACHALAATARLEALLRRGHMRVRLAAQHPGSTNRGRLLRQVSTRIGGRWRDVGAMLLSEGHALWLPNAIEYAWNRSYSQRAQRASLAGLRLWSPSGCAAHSAAPGAQLSMSLSYDAPGDDYLNVNGEWARIANRSATAVPLGGWSFRDSALRSYRFPRGATVPAGGSVLLRMGSGGDGDGVYHWGLPTPPFENPTDDDRALGDGGYLFDPQGDLRAWSMYPWRI